MKDKLIKQLVLTISKCESEDELRDLLKGLLTAAEFNTIATRLEIVRMLKSGVSQREIAEQLQVGIATITRGTREIKLGHFKNIK
ncbi:hypothetical protein A2690_04905 [Candidatus Roizmanbacteria bacterium RIFCSPHIGHO2_01_FULL_39_12b]|uniref:Trp operon repressor n=1 Tax=Candidatus Roizmanbacteria bacterium RIFCSPHIGHO2_01_FULL_39_12b TaxID=1802030 RepID=A0A1F7GCV8_9BACT|nr:MAG: hypothetical protein A2690_04905 [Candidatus Roizmanbacteria bacterium RIFCSPHIGHO2_01_FULL_39_12b]